MKYKSFHLLCEDMNILKTLYPGIYEKLCQLSKAFVFVETVQLGAAYYLVDISIKEKRHEIKCLCRELVLQIYFNCCNFGKTDFSRYLVLSDLHSHLIQLL